jgi:hypothetical protein
MTPNAKSTGASVAMRVSSAMRNSGILVLARDEVELIVAPVLQPTVDQVRAEPAPPDALGGEAPPDGGDVQRDRGKAQRDEEQGEVGHRVDVLALQRVEQVAVPDVQPVLNEELEEITTRSVAVRNQLNRSDDPLQNPDPVRRSG